MCRGRVPAAGLAVALACTVTAGCGTIRAVRPTVRNRAVDRVERLRVRYGGGYEVEAALARHGVAIDPRDDPSGAAVALASRLEQGGDRDPDDTLALGELFFRAGCEA